MTGVDTNVLARLLLADDEDQTKAAQRLAGDATQGDGLFISAFALLELAWVLKGKKLPREEIAGALEGLVSASGVRVSNRTAVLEALVRFRQAPASVGFADCLILSDTIEAGARLFTFDEALRRFDERCLTP